MTSSVPTEMIRLCRRPRRWAPSDGDRGAPLLFVVEHVADQRERRGHQRLLRDNKELRSFLAGTQLDAATGLAELFLGINPAQDPEPARLAGSVLHAMFPRHHGKVAHGPRAGADRPRTHRGLQIIAQRMRGKDL
jgi:hypothetical protein